MTPGRAAIAGSSVTDLGRVGPGDDRHAEPIMKDEATVRSPPPT